MDELAIADLGDRCPSRTLVATTVYIFAHSLATCAQVDR